MTSPLDTFIELQVARRDQARARQADARRAVQAAERQLEDLRTYAREAQARWTSEQGTPTAGVVLSARARFSEGLAQAIDLQTRAVSDRRDRLTHADTELLSCERRIKVLSRLGEIRDLDQRARAVRQERKLADEMAAQAYMRGRSANASRIGALQ